MKITFTKASSSLALLSALFTLSLAAPAEVAAPIEKRTTWPVGLTAEVNYLTWCLETDGKESSAVYTSVITSLST